MVIWEKAGNTLTFYDIRNGYADMVKLIDRLGACQYLLDGSKLNDLTAKALRVSYESQKNGNTVTFAVRKVA